VSGPAGDADAWERAYREGSHEGRWETPWASPELAGALAVLALPRGSTALDVGCGTGADAVFMGAAGLDASGVDLSATALELATRRAAAAGVRVRWLAGDALALPVEAGSVDLVTDRGCLHHLPDDVRARYAAEAFRVLRPGGLLLVRGMSEEGRHKHPVTEEAIRAWFAAPRCAVRHAGPFDMVGPGGSVPATLALVERMRGRQ
jgi:ubiquinone/menaquinone biosynthesis C-methylase UbiE